MTDFKQLDPFRKQADPLQLDLVEAFANGKISRRGFIQRGTVLGLSLASIGAIVAACGGSSSGGSTAAAVDSVIGAASDTATGAVQAGGTMKWGMSVPGSEGFNPITMIDLATYNITAQCFEYLVRSASDLSVQPQLATEWSANADASEWTFKLRPNVLWQDGTPFTSAEVVATFERLIEAGNSALDGVLAKGGTTAVDATTVKFTLIKSNGNFPYLVSSDNSQSQITPVDWSVKHNLEPNKQLGTGPWMLTALDAKTGATFVRNETWWGGKTPLDSVEFVFIEDSQAQVTALQAGEVDGVPILSLDTAEVLFSNPDLNMVEMKSAGHQQVWMRTDTGKFADKRVRQALAYTFDREKMVAKLLNGKGVVANDHVIFDLYPYFDSSVPQRTQDIEMAKQLLKDAGAEGLSVDFPFIKGEEMPGQATLLKEGAAKAGIDLNLVGSDYGAFYGKYWCPAEPAKPPCSGATDIGLVDYGHRGTPDVYLNAALSTNGVWNSSQYASDPYMSAFSEYQAAVGVDAQMAACKTIETILNDEVPIGLCYTKTVLAGYNKKFAGIANTAMGFTFLENAGRI